MAAIVYDDVYEVSGWAWNCLWRAAPRVTRPAPPEWRTSGRGTGGGRVTVHAALLYQQSMAGTARSLTLRPKVLGL